MISTASHCAHGNQMHDCSVCRTSEEIRELRAKLQEAVGIAQKFAEAARDACIAGLAQSSKMRQYEDRIAELEAEVAILKDVRATEQYLASLPVGDKELDLAKRTATEAALKYSYNELSDVREASDRGAFISRAIKALLGEKR